MIALSTEFYPENYKENKESKQRRLCELSRNIKIIEQQKAIIEPKLRHLTNPDPNEFTDTHFLSADEKRKILKQWITFIKYGFNRAHFTMAIYEHLYLHCGYIAHYDLHGFYNTYWSMDLVKHARTIGYTIKSVPATFHQWERFLKAFDIREYNDINSAMMFSLREELDSLIFELLNEAQAIFEHDMKNSYQFYLDKKEDLKNTIDDLKNQISRTEEELHILTSEQFSNGIQGCYKNLFGREFQAEEEIHPFLL